MSEALLDRDLVFKESEEALVGFIRANPKSAHQWEVVELYLERRPYFFTELDRDPRASYVGVISTAKVDRLALAAWRRVADEWIGEMGKDSSVAGYVRERISKAYLEGDLRDATYASWRKEGVDLKALRRRVDDHIARFAADSDVRLVAYGYMQLVENVQPGRVLDEWEGFVTSPNPRVKEVAGARVRWATAKKAPIELKFVAADGAQVDLDTLRGKIVLLDFWATWCGPCKAEIPNVVSAYRKYHDQGFEVVGIALEDTPDSDKLLAFTESHGMSWPELNGGKGFESEAALQFGVFEIPSSILLDKTGRVVSEELRGPDLESNVREQLGL